LSVAAPHPRQQDRLRALHSYEILDSDREVEFDEIVKLAAAACGTAISVVNFIDAERQWFKAETGLGVRETPLATSICSHVILESDFVEIRDTLSDPRMADNPLCCGDPGLRFYAGALLKTAEGLPLGTLCVLDYEPRVLTPLQRDTIRVLASQVMARLELRKSLRHAAVLRQEVDHRVKNSLQSLASLVRLMGQAADNDDTVRTLTTVRSRIEAVSRMHEILYRTDAGPVIDLGEYARNLGHQFNLLAPENVTVEVECPAFSVTSSEAVAVGTLMNEFVANAFKHAFPDGRAGRVRVQADAPAADGSIVVTCADDGVGIGSDTAIGHQGLGMKIAEILSAELRGTLETVPAEVGLTLRLTFRSSVGQSPA
jgi:two-component sensor histidine kinase